MTAPVTLLALLGFACCPCDAEPNSSRAGDITLGSSFSEGSLHSIGAETSSDTLWPGRRLIEDFLGVSIESSTDDQKPSLDVLVATLPDPFDSHLDWVFDSNLESIRRAFQVGSYVLDRFWLPGRTDSIPTVEARPFCGALPGSKTPARRAVPGVLLFRTTSRAEDSEDGILSGTGLFLVYVVPEMPTGGIYRCSLLRALDERESLLADGHFRVDADAARVLKILGPTFSGSASSLRMAIDHWLGDSTSAVFGERRSQNISTVRILSGTATAISNKTTITKTTPSGRPEFTFTATINPDVNLDWALQRLLPRLHIEPIQVAILAEGNTGYGLSFVEGGAQPERTDRGYLQFQFPMNIWRLRSESEQTPRPVVTDEFATRLLADSARIPLSLAETNRPTETPPVQSGLTVPGADVLVEQIVRTLKRHRIKLVGLQATDIRDKIFLAEAIKSRIRDIQLYTYEANVLFLRADRRSSLNGMLIFSSYLLSPEDRRWTPIDVSPVPFPNDGAAGTYNAALIHLGMKRNLWGFRWAIDSTTSNSTARIPTQAAARLPVWVSVVGRTSFSPVDVHSHPPDQSYAFKEIGRNYHRTEVRELPELAVYTNLPFLRFSGRQTLRVIVGFLGFTVITPLAVLAGLLFVAWPRMDKGNRARNGVPFLMMFIGATVWLKHLDDSWSPHLLGAGDASDLWILRAQQLTGGVSPVAPMVVSAIGFLAFCVWQMTRLHQLHHAPSDESTGKEKTFWSFTLRGEEDGPLQTLGDAVGRAAKGLHHGLVGIVPWGPVDLAVLVPTAIVGLGSAFLLSRSLVALDSDSHFALVFSAAVCFSLVGITWLLWLLVSNWWRLKNFLDGVAELPLVYAFQRLPGRIPLLSPLTLLPRKSTELIQVAAERQRKYLQRLRVQLTSGEEQKEGSQETQPLPGFTIVGTARYGSTTGPIETDFAIEATRTEGTQNSPGRGRIEPVQDPSEAQIKSRIVSSDESLKGVAGILACAWDAGPSNISVGAVAKELQASGVAAVNKLNSRQLLAGRDPNSFDLWLWVRCAEEYMAIHLVEFIDRILSQIKWLFLCLLFSLLAGTALLSIYPFYLRTWFKLALAFLMVGGVGTMMVVSTHISRNRVVSMINDTVPGKLEWTPYLKQVFTYVGIPLALYATSEFPTVRVFVAGLLRPLLGLF